MFSSCLGEAANAKAAGLGASDLPSSGTSINSIICRRQFRASTASIFKNTHFTNHESLPSLMESYSEFLKLNPQYSETDMVDRIRDEEYYHLNKSNNVCLDYIGIGLFSYSQVHDQESATAPLSLPSSSDSNYLHMPVFNISILDDEYSMVFTANRASAFKLLAESYPFQSFKNLLTVYDYKSEAVDEMVSTSLKRGAKTAAAKFVWPRFKIHSSKLKKEMVNKIRKKKQKGLFAFPFQSRVTGSRYSCLWMSIARENGWHILFDACALGPKEMKCFGLSLYQPDFIICSFYKIFGDNPSGFGCLFVKKSTIPILEASTTSNIVRLVPPPKKLFTQHSEPCDTATEFPSTSMYAFQEDDTDTSISFSGPIISSTSQSRKLEQGNETNTKIPEDGKLKGVLHTADVDEVEKQPAYVGEAETSSSNNKTARFSCRGLDHVDTLGLRTIKSRERYLVNWLVAALQTLYHPNTEPKIPLVRIYGPKIKYDRSPALAFNIFDWKGGKIEPHLFQKLADRSNISVSYAFLKHIWFPDKYQDEKERNIEREPAKLEDTEVRKIKSEKQFGIKVVIVALGFLTSFEDTYRLWAFVAQFLNADFVEQESWRHTTLNQNTIEL